MWVIGSSLPTIAVGIASTAATTSTIARLSTARSASTASTLRAATVVVAGIASLALERIQKLTLITDKLLQLILVKIVCGVEAIVAAFAFASLHNSRTTPPRTRHLRATETAVFKWLLMVLGSVFSLVLATTLRMETSGLELSRMHLCHLLTGVLILPRF